jgi:hypothetical protein
MDEDTGLKELEFEKVCAAVGRVIVIAANAAAKAGRGPWATDRAYLALARGGTAPNGQD